MPDGVTKIGEKAFQGCTRLNQINIPEGVTEIGEFAFLGCSSLTQITIPANLTDIGQGAFYGCNSLTKTYFKQAWQYWLNPNFYLEGLAKIGEVLSCSDIVLILISISEVVT